MLKMKPSQVRVGMAFSRLTVTHLYREEKPCPSSRSGFVTYRMADAKCDCGRIRMGVRVCHLASGATESCGSCGLREERLVNALTTHDLSHDHLYKTIHNMNERCKNPGSHWDHYGGRGIDIWAEWDRDLKPDTFIWKFLDWVAWHPEGRRYQPGMTIDRIDNDQGYYPDNCRWVPRKIQDRNKQDTIRRVFRGEDVPLIDIYDVGVDEGWILKGINYRCFKHRLVRLGWGFQQACKTPIEARR